MSVAPYVFSVASNADFGVTQYYLDEEGYRHIMLGHRDFRNFTTGIEEIVQNPIHVYRSNYDIRRLQFVSQNVVTGGGFLINVVIEIQPPLGRVITATPKGKIKGEIVWDSTFGLYASYDKRSDVLYLSHGDSRPAYAVDDKENERIWLRLNEDDDSPAGVTVFDVAKMSLEERRQLAAKAAAFLHVAPDEVSARIDRLVT
jgi:hypothetical protein